MGKPKMYGMNKPYIPNNKRGGGKKPPGDFSEERQGEEMTYRQMFERDYPDKVNEDRPVWCTGCPGDYYKGKPTGGDPECDNFNSCSECWNAECTSTAQEDPKAAVNVLKVMLDPGAKMPTRAHEHDAGLDLYSMEYYNIFPGTSHSFDTGVHVAVPVGYVGLLTSKSGMMLHNECTSRGTIDSGYVGSIRVVLFNHGRNVVKIEAGQKISQLVILPIITPELELVDGLDDTERGDGGFGSTGAF